MRYDVIEYQGAGWDQREVRIVRGTVFHSLRGARAYMDRSYGVCRPTTPTSCIEAYKPGEFPPDPTPEELAILLDNP